MLPFVAPAVGVAFCSGGDGVASLKVDNMTWSNVKLNECLLSCVPAGSPSRGGDVVVYAFDINQPNLPTPFDSVLVSISVFMALSTVFHSINSPDNRFLTLFFQFISALCVFSTVYLFMKVSFSPDIILCG